MRDDWATRHAQARSQRAVLLRYARTIRQDDAQRASLTSTGCASIRDLGGGRTQVREAGSAPVFCTAWRRAWPARLVLVPDACPRGRLRIRLAAGRHLAGCPAAAGRRA
jgi:hypothetical protein